jgi:4-amino-4-deoxy-L-arabinose transferase-like glycosyltransferase
LGIRLAAVICGLLTLVFTYLWIRRAFNQRAALIAAALLAVNFWPLFLSRVGLRAASVPMMAALTAWLMADFRLLIVEQSSRTTHHAPRPAILAGIALGLSLYTYPAARTLPVIVAAFFVAHALITRKLSKPLLLVLMVAVIVFAPLGYTIATLPEADVRLQQLGWPVQAALSGNFEPVLRFTRDTLGMFTFGGDPIARYNLPGRPVLDPLTGLLFYLGLVLAIRKWREPRYLFALIWLPIGLLPSMLSDSAPSFLRASASLPVTFLFPALALDWIIANRKDAKTRRVLWGFATIGLIAVTILTIRDYFFEWPNRSDVREVYRSDLAQAAKWIEQQPTDQPIIVAGTNPRDLDPFLFDFQVPTKHDVKWVDRAYTVVFPARGGLLVSPAYSPIDPTLRERLLTAPSFVSKFNDGSTAFEVFDLSIAPVISTSIVTVNDGALLNTPIDFNPSLTLLGYEAAASGKACEWAHFWMYWRVKQDVNGQQLPLSIFVHLLDQKGELKVGRDLLGFPSAGWRTGDVWVQQNDLQLPCVMEPGVYQLEIGVYSQADGSRWRVIDNAGADRGDRLLLSSVEVKP